MPTPTRQTLLRCLTLDDLKAGKGDLQQRGAYEELEWRRCEASFLYWLDSYGWIVLKDGTVSRWTLWPVQRDLGKFWQMGDSTIAVKARQLGVTTLSAHFALWHIIFHEASRWYFVSKDEKSAKDAMSRLRVTKDRLPAWMTKRAQERNAKAGKDGEKVVRRQDKADATESISFGFSKIEVLTSTPKGVQGKSGNFILDEFAAHSDQRRIWHLVQPSFDGGGMVIVIANGDGENEFYHLYMRAKAGENRMKAHFFSWRDDPSRTTEWYERTESEFLIKNPDADRYAFRVQYPSNEHEAFFLHGNTRFDIATINHWAEILTKERSEQIAVWGRHPRTGFLVYDADSKQVTFDRHPTGRCRLYEEPLKDASYIVTVDAAGGRMSSDFCVARVVKLTETGCEEVFVYQAKVEPDTDLAYNAVAAGWWYNEALMLPETGSSGHGQSFTNAIKEDYPNIYREIRTSRFWDDEREELGFSTNRTSRDPLINGLASWLGTWNETEGEWEEEPRYILHDEATLTEMSRFEMNPTTGRAEAPKGGNDDLVITAALAVHGAKHAFLPTSSVRSRYYNDW